MDTTKPRTMSAAVDVITTKEQLNLPSKVHLKGGEEVPLEHINTGKVRETYKCGEDRLLIVTTDRWSAFDRVMPQGIPLKGRILNSMSNLTFALTSDIIPNHIIATDM